MIIFSGQRYFITNNMIFCYKCNKYTNTGEPFVINRTRSNLIKLSGICSHCQMAKSSFISSEIRKQLPNDLVFNTYPHRTFINNIETIDGRILPIFSMVNHIINL